MNPEKDPPTYTGWSQRREKGHFREWYKRGHLWIEKNPQGGQPVICTFEGIPAPRGGDGFTWWYPNGVEPPPPPKPNTQAQRPGQHSEPDAEE